MKSKWPTTSRHVRGYGNDWDKRRKLILRRDFGICQPCLKLGKMHQGNEVDHIVSKAEAKRWGWSGDRIESESNLQTICHKAHQEKTIKEKGFNVKKETGLDGFPIEL